MTLGVEEEFLIVDETTGELVGRAGELFTAARATLGDDVARELNLCQIEIGTPVCTDLAQVRVELTRLRAALSDAAVSIGTRIAATATHPFGSWRDQQIDPGVERYRRIADVYQVIARQQVIAGCHVHVGVDDRDLAVEVMNRCRSWLPAMAALAANSPYWQGVDTGYASYRLQVWERWPTSGMPPRLSSAAELDELIAELVAMEAIEDASFIYWYARPSMRYPTLEYRACDVCLDVDTTVAIAGLARALTWTCLRDIEEGRPDIAIGREALGAAMWRAARYGIDEQLVSPIARAPRPAVDVIDELLLAVVDGLDAHGDREEVTELVHRTVELGNGATRQRAARSRGGDLNETIREIVTTTVPGDDAGEPLLPPGDLPGDGRPAISLALRVELSDEPNSLARIAAALGHLHTNIVDIDVHEVDGAVVDQILVEAPATVTADAVRSAIVAAGARRVETQLLPDLFDRDVGVRSLGAALRLIREEGRPQVTDVVIDVVPADGAELTPIATLSLTEADQNRLTLGMPLAMTVPAATGDGYVTIVPRMGLNPIAFDALVVTRTTAPFSATEIARLRVLLQLHVALGISTDDAFVAQSPDDPTPVA